MELVQVPINEWKDKENVIHAHAHTYECIHKHMHVYARAHTHTQHMMELYLVIEKNEIRPFIGNWMELEIMLSKISQTQKDKYPMFCFIFTI